MKDFIAIHENEKKKQLHKQCLDNYFKQDVLLSSYLDN